MGQELADRLEADEPDDVFRAALLLGAGPEHIAAARALLVQAAAAYHSPATRLLDDTSQAGGSTTADITRYAWLLADTLRPGAPGEQALYDECAATGHPTWGQVGRFGGTRTLDHTIPRIERPELATAVSNLRPVHHAACPICGLRCNNIKGAWPAERAMWIIRERLVKMGLEPPEIPAERDESEPEGRDWDWELCAPARADVVPTSDATTLRRCRTHVQGMPVPARGSGL